MAHRRVCWIAIACLATGCTLIASYPGLGVETGEACRNGIDDDLNGRTDCDDPSCAGPACAELSEVECTDGRDDDGDGLPDHLDPACWDHARLEPRRCESIGPGDFVGSFDALDGTWRNVTGTSVSFVPDPDDPAAMPRTVARVDGPISATLAGDTISGRLVGLTMSFELRLAPGVGCAVGVAREGEELTGAPEGLEMAFDPTGVPFVLSAGLGILPSPQHPPVTGWVHVSLEVVAGATADAPPRIRGSIDGDHFETLGGGFVGREPGEVPVGLRDGLPLRPIFRTNGPGVMLASAEVHMPSYDPCATPTTPAPVPPPALAIGLGGVARRGGVTCAVVLTEYEALDHSDALWAVRSTDDGLHWDAPVPVLDLATLSASEDADHALHFTTAPLVATPTGFAGVAGVVRARGYELYLTRLIRGDAQCDHWQVDETGLDHELTHDIDPASLSYSVGEIDGVADVHEISMIHPTSTLEGSTLLRATSRTGAPPFAFAGAAEVLPHPELWATHLGNGLHVVRVARHRVLIYSDGQALLGIVERSPGAWTPLAHPLIAPSGIVGAFDRTLVGHGFLSFDPPSASREGETRLTGLIAFTGELLVCRSSLCSYPWAVEPFEFRPR